MAAGSIPPAPEIPPIVANRTRRPIKDVVAAPVLLPPFTRRKHAATDIKDAMFYICHTNTDCNMHTAVRCQGWQFSDTDISAGSVKRFGLQRRRFSIPIVLKII
jgi:hypothetical protein